MLHHKNVICHLLNILFHGANIESKTNQDATPLHKVSGKTSLLFQNLSPTAKLRSKSGELLNFFNNKSEKGESLFVKCNFNF